MTAVNNGYKVVLPIFPDSLLAFSRLCLLIPHSGLFFALVLSLIYKQLFLVTQCLTCGNHSFLSFPPKVLVLIVVFRPWAPSLRDEFSLREPASLSPYRRLNFALHRQDVLAGAGFFYAFYQCNILGPRLFLAAMYLGDFILR